MRELVITRDLPCSDASDALHEALKHQLGDKCFGFSGKLIEGGGIRVFLSDDATLDDETTATAIVQMHDFSLRTESQMREAARRERRLALRKAMRAADVTTESDNLARRVEWLQMELEYLLERAGDLVPE